MKTVLAALAAAFALTAFSHAALAGDRFNGAAWVLSHRAGWDDGDAFDDEADRGRAHRGFEQRGDGDVLSERRLIRRLVRQGFVSVDDIDLRGDRFVVQARRPNGAVIRLVVDAYDGDILSRERVGWAHEGLRRGGWRHRDAPDLELDLGGGAIGLYGR